MNANLIDGCSRGAPEMAQAIQAGRNAARVNREQNMWPRFLARPIPFLKLSMTLLWLILGLSAVQAAPVATVRSVVGTCELRSAPAAWMPLKAGQQIEPGQELRCSGGGKLTFSFRGQSVLKILDGDAPNRNSYTVPMVPLSVPESADNRGGIVSSAEPAGAAEEASLFLRRILVTAADPAAEAASGAQLTSPTMTMTRAVLTNLMRSPRTLRTCVYQGDRPDALVCTEIKCSGVSEPVPNICRVLALPEIGYVSSSASQASAASAPVKFIK